MARKNEDFKVKLPDETYDELMRLAHHLQKSGGAVIRELISWRHAMQIDATPTCANGNPCFMAHVHVVQVTKATRVDHPTPDQIPRLVGPPLNREVV